MIEATSLSDFASLSLGKAAHVLNLVNLGSCDRVVPLYGRVSEQQKIEGIVRLELSDEVDCRTEVMVGKTGLVDDCVLIYNSVHAR